MSFTAELPTLVTIAGRDIPVLTEAQAPLPDDANGFYDENRGVIIIRSTLERWLTWACFWHEWCHAAMYMLGLDHYLPEEKAEWVCDVVGNMLATSTVNSQLLVPGKRESRDVDSTAQAAGATDRQS